jgi:hypothetical protein
LKRSWEPKIQKKQSFREEAKTVIRVERIPRQVWSLVSAVPKTAEPLFSLSLVVKIVRGFYEIITYFG